MNTEDLTVAQVAYMCNVSKNFIVRELLNGNLKPSIIAYGIGLETISRIAIEEATRYCNEMKSKQEQALQDLADEAQELGLGYE